MKELISVGEALGIVHAAMEPVARDWQTELVGLREAVGRTLADDVISAGDHPPFSSSAMDGFAVGGEPENGQGPYRLVGESRAGHPFSGRLRPGEAIRIATGAVVPEGTFGVVPVELASQQEDATVSFEAPPDGDAHVRPPGKDVRQGDVAFRRGTRISRNALPMLAMLGVPRVPVYRRPTVAVITTGDELVDASQPDPLAPGTIRDSNAVGLASMAAAAGAEVISMHRAADTPVDLQQAVGRSMQADLVIISGGVSVGIHDHARQVLLNEGVELAFWRVRQRPGKPLAFGMSGNTALFALPGNPVSSAVCFQQYVRRAIQWLLRQREEEDHTARAVLDRSIAVRPGLYHFIRGTARIDEEARLRVQETGAQDSNLISSIVRANCLIHIPEDVPTRSEGELVEIEWFRN